MPHDSVITDRTAAWLLGAPMALAPNDHLKTPAVSMFRPPGYRLRNKLVASGERRLRPRDIAEVEGVLLTTPLRTACDLGRLLQRDQALAGMDALSRATGVSARDIVEELQRRFKGYRGVRQARQLAPWVDGRSESPGESILRLRWRDCTDLPVPTPQVEVAGPDGPCFLDLAVPALRYAAEYDGARWHGPDRQAHDRRRREFVRRTQGYVIDVLTGSNIHGRGQNAGAILRAGLAAATAARHCA